MQKGAVLLSGPSYLVRLAIFKIRFDPLSPSSRFLVLRLDPLWPSSRFLVLRLDPFPIKDVKLIMDRTLT